MKNTTQFIQTLGVCVCVSYIKTHKLKLRIRLSISSNVRFTSVVMLLAVCIFKQDSWYQLVFSKISIYYGVRNDSDLKKISHKSALFILFHTLYKRSDVSAYAD